MLKAFRHVVHAAGYSLAGFRHLFQNELAARLEIGAGVLSSDLADPARPAGTGSYHPPDPFLHPDQRRGAEYGGGADRRPPVAGDSRNSARVAKDLGSAAVFAMLAAAGVFLVAITADAAGLIALYAASPPPAGHGLRRERSYSSRRQRSRRPNEPETRHPCRRCRGNLSPPAHARRGFWSPSRRCESRTMSG